MFSSAARERGPETPTTHATDWVSGAFPVFLPKSTGKYL
jgi:hypothetical protein